MKTARHFFFFLTALLSCLAANTHAQNQNLAKPKGQYIQRTATEGYKWFERNGIRTEVISAPPSYSLLNFKPFHRFTIQNKGMMAIKGPKLKGKWKREGDTLVLKIPVRKQEDSQTEWSEYCRLLPVSDKGFEVVGQNSFFRRQKPKIRPSKN